MDKVYKLFDQLHLDIDLVNNVNMYQSIVQLQMVSYISLEHNYYIGYLKIA